jgi:hypothetical protein
MIKNFKIFELNDPYGEELLTKMTKEEEKIFKNSYFCYHTMTQRNKILSEIEDRGFEIKKEYKESDDFFESGCVMPIYHVRDGHQPRLYFITCPEYLMTMWGDMKGLTRFSYYDFLGLIGEEVKMPPGRSARYCENDPYGEEIWESNDIEPYVEEDWNINNELHDKFICFDTVEEGEKIAQELEKLGYEVNYNKEAPLRVMNCFVNLMENIYISGSMGLIEHFIRSRNLNLQKMSYKEFMNVIENKINENILNDIDPYGEEDWFDENTIKEGDVVLCLRDYYSMLGSIVFKDEKYEIERINSIDPDIIYIKNKDWFFPRNIFKKINDTNEHIHFDDDDDDWIEYMGEMVDLVGLPSGTYYRITRMQLKQIQKYTSWSEKTKAYVYRDKDENKVLMTINPDALF